MVNFKFNLKLNNFYKLKMINSDEEKFKRIIEKINSCIIDDEVKEEIGNKECPKYAFKEYEEYDVNNKVIKEPPKWFKNITDNDNNNDKEDNDEIDKIDMNECYKCCDLCQSDIHFIDINYTNDKGVDFCFKCADNDLNSLVLIDRTNYSIKEKPLNWPCVFCNELTVFAYINSVI
jgi:hypothetical protein